MKCPYCQKEMQTGYIPNGGQPVQWIPYGEKPSVLSFLLRNREFPCVISLNRLKLMDIKQKHIIVQTVR